MKKFLYVAAITSLFVYSVSSAVVLNSSEAVNFNVTNNNQVAQFNSTGLDLNDNKIFNFFNQTACDSDEAIKTIYPNGSYACNSISGTTSAENLSETLDAGNEAGSNNINLSGNNLTEVDTLNPDSNELTIGSNVTVGDGETSIAELNRLTDLPIQPTIDSFEDGDLDEYSVTEEEPGGSASFDVQSDSSFVQDGTRSLNLSVTSSSFDKPRIFVNSSTGLESYPQAGDTFEGFVNIGESNGASKFFVTWGGPNGRAYELELSDTASDSISLLGPSEADSASVTVPKQEFLRVVVDWRDSGEINADVYRESGSKLADLSIQDSTYEKGGIGYEVNDISASFSSSTATFDGFRIIDSGGIEIDSDVQLEDSRLSDVRSINGGGDSVNFNDNLNLGNQNISNFFDQSKCGSNEAVKTVYPNGSYSCNQLSTTTEAENLSETLAAGNVANQTIRFGVNSDTGVQIGDSSTNTNQKTDVAVGRGAQADAPDQGGFGEETAVGYNAKATGRDSSAFGYDAEANVPETVALGAESEASNTAATAVGKLAEATGSFSVALGRESDAKGYDAIAIGDTASASTQDSIAIGRFAGYTSTEGERAIIIGAYEGDSPTATGDDAIGIGTDVSASANRAVAIGFKANAPNPYEATFGNLDGEEVDLNVTGNLTVYDEISDPDSGNVTVDDDLNVTGNLYSSGADLAEVYSSEESFEPGTVVKVSGEGGKVSEASRFDDVAGVVSTDPGLVLNNGEKGVKVALEGRVPVKVSKPVESGEDLAAGFNGRAVTCDTEQVEELSSDASRKSIVKAVNSLKSNQDCLKASFGEALNSSENGVVEVVLD